MEGNATKNNNSEFSSSTDSSVDRASSDTFFLQSIPPRDTKMPNKDSNDTRNRWLRAEFVINTVNHILIGFVTIYMSWMCLRLNLKNTALHAWLCTIGFSFLMAEGVMTHYSANTFLFFYTRKSKTTVHWVLQALGGSLGIAGAIIKITEKEVHFTTTHGKLGLAAIILCGVSMLSGLSALYSNSSLLKRICLPLLNKTFHNLLGIGGFGTALVTQYYGYETGFFKRKVDADFLQMIQVITLLSLVLSCWGPLNALYDKCKNVVNNF